MFKTSRSRRVTCIAGAAILSAAGSVTAQNNDCVDRITIFDGATPFTTVGAATDGLPHASCEGDGQTHEDIWFNYDATCTGNLTVSTCGTVDYDSDLVAYDGCNCPPATFLGCNDEGMGCPSFSSLLTVPVTQGNCYKLRVGGGGAGDEGSGTVTLTCEAAAVCGNGIVEPGEDCDGPGACCQPDCTYSVAECRPSAGVCDPAESCTGTSADCPPDVFITVCIDSDGCCPAGCNAFDDSDCPGQCSIHAEFTFSGVVLAISDPSSSMPAPWNSANVGDPWSITYRFDPATPDSDPSATGGEYRAIDYYSLTIGSANEALPVAPTSEAIFVSNSQPAGIDRYVAVAGRGSTFWEVELADQNDTAFTTDALPVCGDIDLTDFQMVGFVLTNGDWAIAGSVLYHNCGCSNCPPLDPGLDHGFYIAFGNGTIKAQTFRPVKSGTVCQIVHGVRQNAGIPTSFNVYVVDAPGGVVPANYTSAPLFSDFGLNTFDPGGGVPINGTVNVNIASSFTVTAGMDYALIFESVGVGALGWAGVNGGGAYANGSAWVLIGGVWQPASSVNGPADHAFVIRGQCPPSGPDPCANCTPIGVGTICGTTAAATPDGVSSCDPLGGSPDVWYCFTPQCDGMVDIDTCGSSYDTLLSVHSSCPGTLINDVPIGPECDDCFNNIPCPPPDSCGSFFATANTTYYIRVAGFAGASGPFNLTLNHTPALTAANDLCSGAIPIIIGSGPEYGTNIGATLSPAVPQPGSLSPTPCGQSANVGDVWYSVTPDCAGPITVETCNCPCPPSLWHDTVVSVYAGSCSGILSEVACNDDNCPVPPGPPPVGCDPTGTAPPWLSNLTFAANAGVTYYIRVSGYQSTFPTGDFRLDVSQTVTQPSNDLCPNATSVSNGTQPFNTCAATTSGPPSCAVNQDIWYRWDAPCSGAVTVDTCGSLFDTSLAVYSGSCAGLQVACNDNSLAGECAAGPTSQSFVSFTATATTPYFIRVGAPSSGVVGSGQLTISGPYPLSSCPPLSSTCPTGCSKVYQFVGPVSGTNGAWCLREPCCFEAKDLNVAGAVTMTALVNSFVASVNNLGCGNKLQASALVASTGLFKIKADTCGSPFEFRVGQGPATSCAALSVVVLSSGTTNVPNYNPEVYEIPLSGVDCNGNNEDDLIDLLDGTSVDDNGNGTPDECDVACLTDIDCDDGNACSADVCDTKNGFCLHTSNAATGQCCNPVNGALTNIDDSNLCTDDACQPNGSVTHVPNAANCGDLDNDGIRDDACSWYECGESNCLTVAKTTQADLGDLSGACPPDTSCDGGDRFHVLNCFSNQDTTGMPPYPCESNTPFALNVDAGSGSSCDLDGVCDAPDAFHALNCFSNMWFDGSIGYLCGCAGPQPVQPAEPLPRLQKAGLSLRAPASAQPGELVAVDVHLDSGLEALRGYQLHLGTTGGWTDSLELVDIFVNSKRRDYAFAGVQGTWSAFNRRVAQMVVGIDAADGVPAPAGSYLATFTYRVPKDAAGTFTIEVRYDDSSASPENRTFLFGRYAGPIDVVSTTPVRITVAERRIRGRG